jgi:hypothetical protein
MAALIGALRVSLSADTAAFQQGMKRAESQAKSSASSIQRSLGMVKAGFASFVAGISLGAITQGVRAALDYAGSLGEIAQQLGVTTRELQTFRYAVSQNGGSIEQADQALGKFSIALSKALSGSKQTAAAFNAVGVSLDDLRSKSKSEVIGQIADNMKKTGGASANAAAGVALFGRGFQKIIPTLDQGSAGMNELAAAADELGIVLSDEQIQKADQTADKLDALMTVLKTKIAGDVADNSDSILQFADALFDLVRAAEEARAALVRFQQNYNLPNLLFKGAAFGKGVAGTSATTDLETGGQALAIARARGLAIAGAGGGGGSPRQFLGGGGGGSKRSKRAPRDTSLRDAFQFEEEQRRLDMDILRAKQDIATDYVERTRLSIEMLDLERQSFEAGLEYQVKAKELTQAQADAQRLKFAEVDHLRRQAVLDEEEERRRVEYNQLDDLDFDLKMDQLERQADLVETSRERKAIELRILDLAYEEERRRLQRIIDESKDWAEIEAARRKLLASYQAQAADRAGVEQGNRGAGGDYLASLPTDAAKMQEALDGVKVRGLQSLEQGILDVTMGVKGMGEAFREVANQIIADLLRIAIQKAIIAPLAGALFGGTTTAAAGGVGFATGGFTGNIARHKIAGVVHGQEGVLNTRGLTTLGVPNLNALNRGAPLSTVSNDNQSNGDVHIHVAPPRGMTQQEARRTGWAAGRGARERLGNNVRGRG